MPKLFAAICNNNFAREISVAMVTRVTSSLREVRRDSRSAFNVLSLRLEIIFIEFSFTLRENWLRRSETSLEPLSYLCLCCEGLLCSDFPEKDALSPRRVLSPLSPPPPSTSSTFSKSSVTVLSSHSARVVIESSALHISRVFLPVKVNFASE